MVKLDRQRERIAALADRYLLMGILIPAQPNEAEAYVRRLYAAHQADDEQGE